MNKQNYSPKWSEALKIITRYDCNNCIDQSYWVKNKIKKIFRVWSIKSCNECVTNRTLHDFSILSSLCFTYLTWTILWRYITYFLGAGFTEDLETEALHSGTIDVGFAIFLFGVAFDSIIVDDSCDKPGELLDETLKIVVRFDKCFSTIKFENQ